MTLVVVAVRESSAEALALSSRERHTRDAEAAL